MQRRPLVSPIASCVLLASFLCACTPADPTDGPAADRGKADDLGAGDCGDVAPPGPSTCAEQVGWGKCGEPWMEGYCERSCGLCLDTTTEPCVDVPPGDTYSCAEQAAWAKCEEPWMDGYCEASCGHCEISSQLIDPQASPAARELFTYLARSYRQVTLAGQQDLADAEYMKELTGHHPAIVGFDFLRDSPAAIERGARSAATDEALEWAARGGIVTISWHWIAPAGLVDSEQWPWFKGFYTEATTFDVRRVAYERESDERRLVLRDIDAIASRLARLQDAGVPVLWRPLHEGAGAWFWWGAHGGEPYRILWRLLYDHLVNHHQLHNLIWVWNGMDPDFYPGDPYVDVIAEDIYDGERDYGPKEDQFLEATRRYSETAKLVALSETGSLMDPARYRDSSAHWSWFMLWNTHFSRDETWNEDSMKREVYASDLVITLDELPAWQSR